MPAATAMPRAAEAPAPAMESKATANGAAVPNVEVREDFSDTACWNPVFSTDASGKGSVTLKLPDNLTTWTFRGVGVTADTKVGESTVDVIATKPLLIRPVTPRFFVVGDHTSLAAIVQNNTAGDVQAEVALQASGFLLDHAGLATQSVTVPGGGRARLEWWGTAEAVEISEFNFSAKAARWD